MTENTAGEMVKATRYVFATAWGDLYFNSRNDRSFIPGGIFMGKIVIEYNADGLVSVALGERQE